MPGNVFLALIVITTVSQIFFIQLIQSLTFFYFWQLGMGSALETLCGQAFGAKHIDMLGIYMQGSWLILNATALVLMFLNIFATQILTLIGQQDKIAQWAGKFSLWMIPMVFAYAFEFPIMKFLQAQSKIMTMAVIAGVSFPMHTLLTWLFMLKLGLGLVDGAVILNCSWWLMVAAKMMYIFRGNCGEAWFGFSWEAFKNLWAFVGLSLASGVMIWYVLSFHQFCGFYLIGAASESFLLFVQFGLSLKIMI